MFIDLELLLTFGADAVSSDLKEFELIGLVTKGLCGEGNPLGHYVICCRIDSLRLEGLWIPYRPENLGEL